MMKIFALALGVVLTGCAVRGRGQSEPIVHPTDSQIEQGSGVDKTQDAPYVPWWIEVY